MFSDVLRALRGISEEWQLIVDQYMMPKCELLGYCPEKRGCGRKPKKESN
jgi:thymidylate synthase (FAD)